METEEKKTCKPFPFGEGHLHIFMNGKNYREAVKAQSAGVNASVIRENFAAYQKRGITWLRDGGDIYGTSRRAMEIAPEYGITYRTPVFAIHREGHYGGIVGKAYSDLKEYVQLIQQLRREGGQFVKIMISGIMVFAIHREGHYGGIVGKAYSDLKEYVQLIQQLRREGGQFVKIMISGIMDFDRGGLTEESLPDGEIWEMVHIAHEEGFSVMAHTNGSRAVRAAALAGVDSIGLTEESLPDGEIWEMVHIAHEEGFSVMAHTNGSRAVRAAALAGVDSIEHGNFCDEDALSALAASSAVWVPTTVTVKNLLGDGRFPENVIQKIWEGQKKNLKLAYKLGVKMALGSDAGAYRVLHGQGLIDEYQVFQQVLSGDWPDWEKRILEGDRLLREKFS